jgi:hypothetical protein
VPFSHDAFLDVFGAFNSRFWPVALLLWGLTALAAWRWRRSGRLTGQSLYGLLAVHWVWSGVAYHWVYFREINPAATFFAAGFVMQAALFTWLALQSRETLRPAVGPRRIVGAALVVYGLIYPAVGFGFGLEYPRLPLFAVPCPTTLVTAGFLVGTSGVPRLVAVLPLLWAVIGSSAAFALGIRADLALIVAAAALATSLIRPAAARR